MHPVFSVIIPFFNRANTLRRAIGSVLLQTYTDFELILVDDCSTDDSLAVVKSFSDSRIVVLSSKENRGPAHARNMGISHARGIYISFLDSDDEFYPFFLQESFNKMQQVSPKVGFIWTGVNFVSPKFPEGIAPKAWSPQIHETSYKTFLTNIHVGTGCGLTVKKEVFEKVGPFDSTLKAAEDTEFFLRAAQAFDFDWIQKTMVTVHKESHNNRISKQYDKVVVAYEIILERHFKEIEKDKGLRLKYFYKLLWLEYHTKQKKKARIYFKRILKDSPFHTKSWATFFLFEMLGYKWGRKIHLKISSS